MRHKTSNTLLCLKTCSVQGDAVFNTVPDLLFNTTGFSIMLLMDIPNDLALGCTARIIRKGWFC